MRFLNQSVKLFTATLFATLLINSLATAEITDEIPIRRWLVSGNIPLTATVFESFSTKDVLLNNEICIDDLNPVEGEKVTLYPGF